MSKKKIDDQKKNPAVTPAKNTKTQADPKQGAKPKLKIRELTEEEAGEVTGGAGGQAAFCRGD